MKSFGQKSGLSRILAVDDDEEICNNIQLLMKDTGVIVDTACKGEDAIPMIQKHVKLEKITIWFC